VFIVSIKSLSLSSKFESGIILKEHTSPTFILSVLITSNLEESLIILTWSVLHVSSLLGQAKYFSLSSYASRRAPLCEQNYSFASSSDNGVL